MTKFEELISRSTPVLVDFFATWCGPCKMMHPILEEVKSKVGEQARVVKVDVDAYGDLATSYGVRAVPTLMIFKDGELKWRASGVQMADAIVTELQKWM